MPIRPLLALALLATLLTTAACGGGGGGGSGDATLSAYDLHVDAVNGNDSGDGTPAAPLKTITEALSRAIGGESIKVQPGLYDVVNGEAFPLVVPAGVRLEGDLASRGNGVQATGIVGASDPGPNGPGRTIDVGMGSEVAGFMLENPPPHPIQNGQVEVTVVMREAGGVLRRCTIQNSTAAGVYIADGASGGAVIENDISYLTGNGGIGIVCLAGGSAFKVQGNRIRNNQRGIAVIQATPDLGGGVAGSLGQNIIAQNTDYDLRVIDVSLSARDNRWDHVAPHVAVGNPTPPGTDIGKNDAALQVDVTGASLYLSLVYLPKLPFFPQP